MPEAGFSIPATIGIIGAGRLGSSLAQGCWPPGIRWPRPARADPNMPGGWLTGCRALR